MDKFVEPGRAPWCLYYWRLIKLCPVPEDLWDCIRDQVCSLLGVQHSVNSHPFPRLSNSSKKRDIMLTSVDLVTWLDEQDNQEIQEEEEDGDDDDVQNYDDDYPLIEPIEYGQRNTTNLTIWVGVLPDSLTGAVAHESATEIFGLPKELDIAGVDVAYRMSVAKFL